MDFSLDNFVWTRQPESCKLTEDTVEIITRPHTDLWQRTYYHFRNDSAPVFQMETEEKYFSFVVKTEFESKHRFDQCGVVMYLDSENWLKASIEYENEEFQHLGSVVTNLGYSDWATTEIDASVKSMWYRLSRREDDYCIECSPDGQHFSQMRICHMHKGGGTVRFGIYACSPEASSFRAVFRNMALLPCQWLAHDGQQPDARDRDALAVNTYFWSMAQQDTSPVVVCDLEHTILYMNPAAVARYEKYGGEKLLGCNLLACHNSHSAAAIRRVLDWFQASPEHNRVHTAYAEREDTDIYMVALRDETGRLVGYYEKHELRARDAAPFYCL